MQGFTAVYDLLSKYFEIIIQFHYCHDDPNCRPKKTAMLKWGYQSNAAEGVKPAPLSVTRSKGKEKL
jgi:hypothetical protein